MTAMRPLGWTALAVTFFLFFVPEGAWAFTQGVTNPVVPNQMRRISLRQRSRQLSLAKLKTATDDKPLTLPAGVTLAPQLSLDSDGHVIAVGPIKHRGVPLMTAPRKNALITEVGKDGFEEARLRLACKLMHIDSKTLPGIDMLPRGVDLPAKWSEDELKELQWAPLQEAAKADKAFLEQAWQRLGVDAPLDAFVDAASVARRYAVPCVGASINDPETMVLLPESSIFERTAPRGGRMLLCSETDEVQIVSDGSHDLGTWGASMSSGWVTNDDLLLYEGWADPNLQSDAVPLSLDFLRGAAQGVLGQEEEVRRQQDQVLKSLERYQYLNLNDDDGCGPSLSILHGGYASDDLGKVLQVRSLSCDSVITPGL